VIFGIGTDIIEVGRIENMVARGKQYLEAIFTEKEMEYCESKARRYEYYAARYAAKEAMMKAFGTGWRDGLTYLDIEIVHDELGRPQVDLHGYARELFNHHQISQVSISISHSKENAIAVIILERE
jgi:holo-[acyl-carrier protein] synthase